METKSYSALVRHKGNENLFRAIELSIVSVLQSVPLHFHVEGLRGTGKTTIIRAARNILPYIERIRGCVYNCHPDRPHCPLHRGKPGPFETEWIRMPLVEISQSAKLGTIVGSIDLERLTDRNHPEAALRPGSLAQAHRGIVLVDEINRLADTSPELADVLLDVMGTKPGRLQIEETGLGHVELPVQVAVWAASNPDEEPGPLEDVRRQLSDRFDLLVTMSRPTDRRQVGDILRQSGLHAQVPNALAPQKPLQVADATLRTRLALSGGLLPEPLGDTLTQLLSDIYVDFGLESLRAIEAWQLAAQLAVLLDDGRASPQLLADLAPLVLGHRVDLNTMGDIVRRLRERTGERNLAGFSSDWGETGGGRPGPEQPDGPGGQPEQPGDGLTSATAPHSETLWSKLFDRVRDMVGGRAPAEENPGGPPGSGPSPARAPAEDPPGVPSEPGGESPRRDEVSYHRGGAGSPARPGRDSGQFPAVVAPARRAHLLRQLPSGKWVPEADE